MLLNKNSILKGVALSISFIVGSLVYINGNKTLEIEAQKKFIYEAITNENRINNNIDKYNKIILSINALLLTNQDMSLKSFNDNIHLLNLKKFYPALDSFVYVSYKSKENYYLNNNSINSDLDYYSKNKNNTDLIDNIFLNEVNAVKKRYKNINKEDLYVIRLVEPVDKKINLLGLSFNHYKDIKELINKNKELDSKIIPLIKNGEYVGFLNVNIDKKKIINEILEDNSNISFKIKNNENYIELTKNINTNYIYEANISTSVFDDSIYMYVNNENVYKNTLAYILLYMCSLTMIILFYYPIYKGLCAIKDFLFKFNLKEEDIKLEKMAWYDSLTNLYNRSYFLNSMEKRIKKYKNNPFTLFFIDLDGFKKVNDTLGHHAGDNVLRDYAMRLNDIFCLDEKVEIARVGGDEFVICLSEIDNVEDYINKIKKATSGLFEIDNHKFTLSQSIGVAFYPDTGLDIETLLRKADMAMYIAKKSDTYDYVIYSEKVGQELIERNKMENNLRESINGGELYLLYQPKISINEQGIKDLFGFEALMRWNSPVWGEVGPDKFIPIAEQNGFIDEMTKWLVKESCNTINFFEKELNKTFSISINLSAKQFTNIKLAQQFLNIINDSKINKHNLIFEITESTIMTQPENAEKIIDFYRKNNIKIALDDFGTGYSSFAYLSKFTVDEIKIDKMFIDNIVKNESDKALVEAIILMAHRLKLKVVAEGIENKEQYDYLKSVNCDLYQGYYFSRPLYSHQIDKFFKNLNL